MKFKIFIAVCSSILFITFPQNIIGCGGGFDSYDYYTSFFNPDITLEKNQSPFYFTRYETFYNTNDVENVPDVLSKEWAEYCGTSVSKKDAKAFVMDYSIKDVSTLYTNIENKKDFKIPDSVSKNLMTKYFKTEKDFEALGYIMFAKKIEPYVSNGNNQWEAIERDSLKMDKQIKNGIQLYNAAKKDFIKTKYAYQIIRLAFYSGNNNDAIKYYDNYFSNNNSQTVLAHLSLALKAGALYRLGKNKDAVYLFSKVFNSTDANKISNFISFGWATNNETNRIDYLSLCKNDEEKAGILSLFALSSAANEINTIEQIVSLNPNNRNIETLIAREINKFEEAYFSPTINKEKGGGALYYYSENNDSILNAESANINKFKNSLLNLAKSNNKNAALFNTSAAYCALMLKDYKNANTYLNTAKEQSASAKVTDQWMLTKLLLTINEQNNIDKNFEEQLLPSLKWLQTKANTDKGINANWEKIIVWKTFYGNIVNIALAKKYHAQGDIYKEALCVGNANFNLNNGTYSTLDFLHNQMDIKDVEKLYSFLIEKNHSEFDKFFIKNNVLNIKDVAEFAGTAYLRSYDYEKAITWLQKYDRSKSDTIFKSAFIELLDDRIERLPTEKKTTSKLSFAKEMLEAKNLAKSDKKNEAKYFYKLATGMYNITYYGHAWELVQYYRSGSDGYAIPKDATDFQKQYYGCQAAHDMYKKAFDASSDKNFKSKCLFMMAKCAQKMVRHPQYYDYNNNWDAYDVAMKYFWPAFKNNNYFPQLTKDYSDTKFYKEAFDRCSYLRDFTFKK